MIPGQEDFEAELKAMLHDLLAAGSCLLRHGISLVSAPPAWPQPIVNENRLSLHLSRGLLVKSCKLFRSALWATGVGADETTQHIIRTMFEAATAMSFLTKESLRLHGCELTRAERAQIYSAHQAINFVRRLEDFGITPGIDLERVKTNADNAKRAVGPEWATRLSQRPRTYSGSNLKDLSHLLCSSLGRVYDSAYGPLSIKSHALDAGQHVTVDSSNFDTTPTWHPSVPDIANSFQMCSGLMGHTILCFGTQFKIQGFDRDEISTLLQAMHETVEQQFDATTATDEEKNNDKHN